MNRPFKTKIIGSVLALCFTSSALVAEAQIEHKSIPPEQLEFFEKNIRPVLVQHCYECHSEEKGKSKGELTLDTRDGIRAGGGSRQA